jgi:hypothetical protein
MKTTNEIKDLFNENISEIDFTIHVSLLTLDKLGWLFEDIIDYEINNREMKNLEIEHENRICMIEYENFTPHELISVDYDEVKEELFSDLVASVRIEGNIDEFSTNIEINNRKEFFSFISNGCANHTGDDEQTIKDIIEILTENGFSIENYSSMYGSQRSYPSVDDYSTDINNNYLSLFKILLVLKINKT